jgi:hypothetical protein
MGVRQHFYDKELDSGVAFIKGNIKVHLWYAPHIYVCLSFFASFLCETAYPLVLIPASYLSWFYLRFLMRSLSSSQLGNVENDDF